MKPWSRKLKLFGRNLIDPSIITVTPRRGPNRYPRVELIYAHKDGSPVLKETPRSWSYISGVWFNGNHRNILFEFRRWG